MQQTIFYSWQSDLDAALTRNFIEDALRRAAKAIAADDETTIDPVIDRDTFGVGGSPAIADTIFRKIDRCDIFVCDVSLINLPASHSRGLARFIRPLFEKPFARLTPNPNVLVELGYASARLGWDRIVLVQNTSFGPVEQLPFDLRGRRIVPYQLTSREARQGMRPEFRGRIEAAVRDALATSVGSSLWKGKDKPRWFGTWKCILSASRSGILLIREVGAHGFIFHLNTVNGGHIGNIGGFAVYTGPDSAHAVIQSSSSAEPCELRFRRTKDNKRVIHVDESYGCNPFKGAAASFNGSYICEQDLLFDSGALDELDAQRLYLITGAKHQDLLKRFPNIGDFPVSDSFPAKAWDGGAQGLYGYFSAIVMRGENGELWAAYIDDEVVRYFTTESGYAKLLPQTIVKWRERCSEKQVIYEERSDAIPPWAQHSVLYSLKI